jgi:hypothetical protein
MWRSNRRAGSGTCPRYHPSTGGARRRGACRGRRLASAGRRPQPGRGARSARGARGRWRGASPDGASDQLDPGGGAPLPRHADVGQVGATSWASHTRSSGAGSASWSRSPSGAKAHPVATPAGGRFQSARARGSPTTDPAVSPPPLRQLELRSLVLPQEVLGYRLQILDGQRDRLRLDFEPLRDLGPRDARFDEQSHAQRPAYLFLRPA